MGWLDNSTNNIILDAVLTDYGRQALARNDGSFKIAKFALGDDEVNYGIVTKFGRTVGREKIEKNTPVFEALTNQNLALKYKLIGIPVPLVYLPKLSYTGSPSSVSLTSGGNNAQKSATVDVKLSLSSSDSSSAIESTIADSTFDVYIPSLFLVINDVNSAPGDVGLDATRTVHVPIPTAPGGNATERSAKFTLTVKTLSLTTFQTYGKLFNGKYVITTSVRVVGQNSGLVLDIPVTINQP
jgi:hypothetical protein